VTTFVPPGRAAVVNVAVPVVVGGYGVLTLADPKTVVVPLFSVEKLTAPTPVDGVTVAVKVTPVPALTMVAAVEIVTELAVRELAHAVARVLALTEPRPVT
jgi:hypothetical protein